MAVMALKDVAAEVLGRRESTCQCGFKMSAISPQALVRAEADHQQWSLVQIKALVQEFPLASYTR